MSNQEVPAIRPGEAPPAYNSVPYERDGHLAAPSTTHGHQLATPSAQQHDGDNNDILSDDDALSGIVPSEDRHSFENATRELPSGWVRQFDPKTNHVYFVDTTKTPPRSTWIHPYDDPDYLMTLPRDDPKRAAYEQERKGQVGGSSTQTQYQHGASTNAGTSSTTTNKQEKKTLGRKMKDKLTGTTHEQREKERQRRRELERKQYEEYLRRRAEIIQAQQSGAYAPMYGPPPVDAWGRPVYSSPYGYRNTYGAYGQGYGYRRGPGFAGPALGLAGGLLLGSALF